MSTFIPNSQPPPYGAPPPPYEEPPSPPHQAAISNNERTQAGGGVKRRIISPSQGHRTQARGNERRRIRPSQDDDARMRHHSEVAEQQGCNLGTLNVAGICIFAGVLLLMISVGLILVACGSAPLVGFAAAFAPLKGVVITLSVIFGLPLFIGLLILLVKMVTGCINIVKSCIYGKEATQQEDRSHGHDRRAARPAVATPSNNRI